MRTRDREFRQVCRVEDKSERPKAFLMIPHLGKPGISMRYSILEELLTKLCTGWVEQKSEPLSHPLFSPELPV